MDSTLVLAVLVIFILTLCGLLWPKRRPKNFPPGPKRWPIFGNALQIFPNARIVGMEMSKTYGPILGIQLGSYWAVMLNNADLIREFFNKPEFSGRHGYNPFFEENISDDTKGVVMTYGQKWQDLRRFSMRTLRDLGLGRRSIESIIQEEVQELIEKFRQKNVGTPFSTRGIFNASVLNIIWSIVAGQRYKLDDERLAELIQAVLEVFDAPASPRLKRFNFLFPALVNFNKRFLGLNQNQQRLRERFEDFLRTAIREHRETIQIGAPRDFIDSFLEEYKKSPDDDAFGKKHGDEDDDSVLIAILMDLFGAGSETTSTTLNWAFYLLALHQDAQEELFTEIDSVVGNRHVCLDDRAKLPMAEAVMNEVYRISSLAAFGVPHAATEDVFIRGYRIPKNTLIFGNLYSAHYEPETWGDPKEFRPQRFLSEDKKTFVRHANVMPFSVGKRQCIGESLAKDEFFIFLTNIVQQMKIMMPPDEPKHSLEAVVGLVLMPEPHRILLVDRNT